MLKIIEQFVRRMLMGKGSGILQIPPKKDVTKFSKNLLKKFKANGIPDSAIKNPRDVKIIWEQITNREARIMQNNMMNIVREGTEKFKTKKSADVHPFQGFTPKVIEGSKRKEGIEKIDVGEVLPKESPMTKDEFFRIKQGLSTKIKLNTLPENKQLAKEFINRKNTEFNSLNETGKKEILERLEISIKNEQSSFATPVKPEDMASGGIARVGMSKGGALFKFIEGLFIKASNDIRLGKGMFKGLDQKQRMVQHDNLVKKMTEWQKTKTLPEGMEQYFGIDAEKAFTGATKKVKSGKEEVITVDGEIAKKSDRNRAPTADEVEDYMSDLPHGGEMDWYDFGNTIDELDKAVADHKAYVANQYQRYKRGDLDKYVKPEVLEEQRLSYQKKIDNVLDKAYDEVFYQRPSSGDYKHDADVLSDSIAEQLGKVYDDLPIMHRSQIYDTALNRVTQDMQIKKRMQDIKEKIELDLFDTKGKTPHAEGGIAGELHLNEGGRVPMWLGGGLSKGKDLLRELMKYFSKGSKHGKSPSEMLKLVNPKVFQKYLDDPSLYTKYNKETGIMAPQMIQEMMEKIGKDRVGVIEDILRSARNIKKADDSAVTFKTQVIEDLVSKGTDRKTAEMFAEQMSEVVTRNIGPKNVPKITDEGLLQLETIQKNLIMKDRQLNAEGGRVSLSKGGLAHILGV